MATIEYDPADELLILRGGGTAVRHPLLAAFTRQVGGALDDDGSLRIPTAPEELTNRYPTLSRLLAQLALEIATGEHVSDALARVASQEPTFVEFSRQDREIWDAPLDSAASPEFLSAILRAACRG